MVGDPSLLKKKGATIFLKNASMSVLYAQAFEEVRLFFGVLWLLRKTRNWLFICNIDFYFSF